MDLKNSELDYKIPRGPTTFTKIDGSSVKSSKYAINMTEMEANTRVNTDFEKQEKKLYNEIEKNEKLKNPKRRCYGLTIILILALIVGLILIFFKYENRRSIVNE